jgi:hypothetical protein
MRFYFARFFLRCALNRVTREKNIPVVTSIDEKYTMICWTSGLQVLEKKWRGRRNSNRRPLP